MSKRNTPAKKAQSPAGSSTKRKPAAKALPPPKKARTSPSQTKATQAAALDFEFDDDSMVIPGALKPAKHVDIHTDFNAQLRECHLGFSTP